MHIADAIELFLANHDMPKERIACAWTTQLEQSQESQLSATEDSSEETARKKRRALRLKKLQERTGKKF